MRKRVHNLVLNERIQHSKPPMSPSELEMLHSSLDLNGCINPLIVWKGTKVLVDGYNRYNYCRQKRIPFDIVEKEFVDEDEATMWASMNMLAQRNISNYTKCRMLMFYGEKIEATAEKFLDLWPVTASNSTKYEKTIKLLADMAGVSLSEFYQADYIEHEGDERTRIRAMIGEISIQEAYRSLTNPLEPDAKALKDAPNDSVVENKYRVKPIREQVEHLASRVNDGNASPKAIVAELSRLAELIDDVGA